MQRLYAIPAYMQTNSIEHTLKSRLANSTNNDSGGSSGMADRDVQQEVMSNRDPSNTSTLEPRPAQRPIDKDGKKRPGSSDRGVANPPSGYPLSSAPPANSEYSCRRSSNFPFQSA